MASLHRTLMVLGLFAIMATVQGSGHVQAAGTPGEATQIELARVEAALNIVVAGVKVADTKAEARRILAVLKAVKADRKAAADKQAEADRILAALLTKATGEQADAAKVEALQAFYRVAAVKSVQPDPRISPMGAGCDQMLDEQYGENIFGSTLWGYFQQIDYCWNDGILTSIERERWGETYWILWHFDGHIDNSTYGGVGEWRFRGVTQGHFSYCLAWQGVGCIQQQYPRSDRTVYAG